MHRILVTGASGFLGSALVAEGRRRGLQVRTANRNPVEGTDFAVGAIGSLTDWRSAVAGIDVIIHCAARVHQMAETATQARDAYHEANALGTLRLARQAIEAGVRRLVFVSSIKVNGEQTAPGAPFTSHDEPDPAGAYAASKLDAEIGLRELADAGAFETVVVRPPLVYGPGVKANFAGMMRLIDRGIPLPLGAVTANHRSLIGLDNLVDLLLTCAESPAAANQTFLASDGEDLSTAGLITRLAKAMGRQPRMLSVPPIVLAGGAAIIGKREIAKRLLGSLQVDIGYTKSRLGWTPPLTVDDGLRRAAATMN